MKRHYYSPRLKDKLSLISEAKTTLIEAPSGYGKTTAVKDYLDGRKKEGAGIFWFTTAAGETVFSAWSRVCRVLEQIDPEAGERLFELGIPTDMTIGEIAETLQHFTCTSETYLVIDDYHLLDGMLGAEMQKFLFCHGGEQLHVIFIAQVFRRSTAKLARRLNLDMITQKDLTFTPGDVEAFFRQSGVENLTPEQAEQICRKSGGWVIALCLQLEHCLDTGDLDDVKTGDILQLMQSLEWDDLDEDYRHFMLMLSPFDSVTYRQICHILDENRIPERIETFLEQANFIRYEPSEERYFPHVILRKLVKKKFENASLQLKREALSKAGSWYGQTGMQAEAIDCFYQIRDWEGILKLPHVGLSLSQAGGKEYTQIILELLAECPEEIKARYPVTLLRFLYVLFGAGLFQEYEHYLQEVRELIEKTGSDRQWLLGEWTLMSIYTCYPDLKKMKQLCAEAKTMLPSGRSLVVSAEEPFAFGCVSLWFLLHNEAGRADTIGDELEEYLSLYTSITGGRGRGGDSLYRGELACMRADFTRAEILAYKAAEEGERNRQITVCFGAALLLGRIALARSDQPLFEYAVSYLEKSTVFFETIQPPQMVVRMREVVHGMLSSMQEKNGRCASWALDGKLTQGSLTLGSLMTGHIYITHLIAGKEYTRAVGLLEYMLTCDARICTFVARQYIYVTLSICYLALKQTQHAVDALKQALDSALPDQIVVNLMRFLPALKPLVMLPEIKALYGEELEQLKKLELAYAVNEQSVYYIGEEPTPDSSLDALSARELEVAELVAEGRSNREIAQVLCISETTVKFHMRTIFSKMQIDRRSKLVKMLH